MKTKTITKTFYVSDEYFERIKNNSIGFSTNENDVLRNQIQISWQEPEKKIEITESEFEEIWLEVFKYKTHDMRVLKQKLFGASDE